MKFKKYIQRTINFSCIAGIFTGNCVPSDRSVKFTCEIKTWCPVENDKLQ